MMGIKELESSKRLNTLYYNRSNMKLLPSLKQKKRYILFEILGSEKFSKKDVKDEVQVALKDFLGVLGLSRSGVIFVNEKFKDNKFLLRCNHKHVDEVISAIILIKTIKNKKVNVKSVKVSGILKKSLDETLKSIKPIKKKK